MEKLNGNNDRSVNRDCCTRFEIKEAASPLFKIEETALKDITNTMGIRERFLTAESINLTRRKAEADMGQFVQRVLQRLQKELMTPVITKCLKIYAHRDGYCHNCILGMIDCPTCGGTGVNRAILRQTS